MNDHNKFVCKPDSNCESDNNCGPDNNGKADNECGSDDRRASVECNETDSYRASVECCGPDSCRASDECCGPDSCRASDVRNVPDECCKKDCHRAEQSVKNVSAALSPGDVIGGWKARWGIGRMDYSVEPGLYALGKPDNGSPVFVSANYKLTFDTLRKNLDGVDCWLLILDTKGINVWCAAGKGTFGTEELIRRIEASELSKYVSHKRLILPQLGATGVSAHTVKRESGFDVKYGPVRASDIKEYINAGYEATKEMRTVQFNLWDRLVLTPMELLPAIKYALPVFGVMLLANQFAANPFDKTDVLANAGAIISGTVLTPAMLPHIPGKAFSAKGWIVGLGVTACILGLTGKYKAGGRLLSAGHLLLFPAVSSFLAMNFTGSSTYTSPSGVNKEMKNALPFIVGAAAVGVVLTIMAHMIGGKKERQGQI